MTSEVRYDEYASAVGLSVSEIGEAATIKRFGCSRGFARYHGRKHVDPQFHSGAWGGSKGGARYGPDVTDVIRFLLWQEVKADPLRTIKQFTEVMNAAGWLVSHDWINRTFKSWGISRQRPSYKNLNKFTTSNILYYRLTSLFFCVFGFLLLCSFVCFFFSMTLKIGWRLSIVVLIWAQCIRVGDPVPSLDVTEIPG